MTLVPDILYDDQTILVVNKPAGIVVNRAESVNGETVQDWVENKYKVQSTKYKVKTMDLAPGTVDTVFAQRSGIAHRLDKETSGCLLIAKNPATLAALMAEFKARTVHKTYLALVHGRVEPREGGWRLPIGRSRFNRTEFRVDPFGKASETAYRVEKYYEDFTLLQLFPKTGRTHQLRVHCQHMKHPIVGDDKYASAKQFSEDSRWCPRIFLHAAEIAFVHPTSQVLLKIQAPLPKDLETVLGRMHE